MGKDDRSRWEPRRRGFEDSRSRQDHPEPDFFQRQATSSPAIDAEVKWFSSVKGFGFVQLSDSSDAFLHTAVLQRAGHTDVGEGTRLKVRVEQGQKGKHVSEVVEVGQIASHAASAERRDRTGPREGGEEQEAVGVVNKYDSARGFGFIRVEGLSKDVFVHVSALNRSGLGALEEGQSVVVKYVLGHKGPEARAISRK